MIIFSGDREGAFWASLLSTIVLSGITLILSFIGMIGVYNISPINWTIIMSVVAGLRLIVWAYTWYISSGESKLPIDTFYITQNLSALIMDIISLTAITYIALKLSSNTPDISDFMTYFIYKNVIQLMLILSLIPFVILLIFWTFILYNRIILKAQKKR